MYAATSEEMRRLDARTITEIGIPAAILMENAGRQLACAVQCLDRGQSLAEGGMRVPEGFGRGRRPGESAADTASCGRPWALLVGKGNNGGDGLVAARHLQEAGIPVCIVYAHSPDTLRGEAALQRDIAVRLGIPWEVYEPGRLAWKGCAGLVDALLGTGTKGAPRAPYDALIREANASGLPIVAADLPSGLDADTGEAYAPCIAARATVAFALPQRGLLQHPGAALAGEVAVAPIGIPGALVEDERIPVQALTAEVLRQSLGADPEHARASDSHKGTYGHVLAAAGSAAMSGAGLLCSTAALRAGAGLVTWAVPETLAPALAGLRPELMLAPLPDGGRGDWAQVDPVALAELAGQRDALVLGPGLGRFPQGDAAWLRRLWEALPAELPLVLDADALGALAEADDFAQWPRRSGAVVLTPHPGEMGRLTRTGTAEVQRDRIACAMRYARDHAVTLVLKGARTVIAAPGGRAYVNPTGNPGMATGGTGDVLSGIVAALLAGGLEGPAAAALGVYLHGAAGDRAAARRRTPGSLIASDVIEAL
ncbi:NAD(P)H-hydrate dehydratase [Paenibacillus sp. IB182496]|uniref:Bifunctional NAD(P)H-hydrate repair enzyme n=1 Tax=Paenibacillus sabuli TaxID=2772509 RepID=A0A927GQB2_9BACL|nr:NAD(P)H-hydrate dehydratase [Paenibacillus sabuli]MBD2844334.1 NAD(P)H-hydrate dehydratase [Paenibacillus sabuli]